MKAVLGLTAVIALLVTGCSTTQRVAVKEDDPAICAFLQSDRAGSSGGWRHVRNTGSEL